MRGGAEGRFHISFVRTHHIYWLDINSAPLVKVLLVIALSCDSLDALITS